MHIEVVSNEVLGREGGFLAIRRLRVVNVRDDGSRSPRYLCDFVVRDKGLDAVVVGVYRRTPDGVRVLVREGLRIPLIVGRPVEQTPVPDGKVYAMFREVVAGIIEKGDEGEAGVRRRAALEVEEEAGFHVHPDAVQLLGAGTFPSPGAMAEKFWLAAVEVNAESGGEPAGDGSPMEEGAQLEWWGIDEAIAACVAGDIEDAKTELVLRRLKDRLAS